MKHILLSSFLFIITFSIQAQDLIVTQNQDSIIATITKAGKNKLHYTTTSPYGIVDYTQEWSDISDTVYHYYEQNIADTAILIQLHKDTLRTKKDGLIYCSIVAKGLDYLIYSEVVKGKDVYHIIPNYEMANYRVAPDPKVLNEGITDDFNIADKNYSGNNYPRYNIILAGGYGRRLVGVSKDLTSDQKDYNEGFLNGYFMSVGASYYFKRKWGLGAKLSSYRSYSKAKMALDNSEGGVTIVPVSSNQQMNYIGGIFNYRTFSQNGKFEFIAGVGAGAFYYRDYGYILTAETSISASTFALSMEANFIYHITEYLGLTLHSSLVAGSFSNILGTIGDSGIIKFEEDELVNGNRFELGIGISFRF